MRAYDDDWRDFAGWCAAAGLDALPASPETVGRFLAARAARLRPSTLEGRLTAIMVRHRQAGHPLDRRHPAIADTLAGIRRALGTAPDQKAPLLLEDLRSMIAAQPKSVIGVRDAAILALGWAGAFRRAELAALELRDLRFTSEGLAVALRRSKENQEGRSELKGLPLAADPGLCPVRLTRAWLIAAQGGEGPVFRRIDRHGNLLEGGISGEAVGLVVKRAARLAGRRAGWSRAETEARVAAVAGHSLRSGLVTEAARAGASELEIVQLTGHRSTRSLRSYVRQARLFEAPALKRIGL